MPSHDALPPLPAPLPVEPRGFRTAVLAAGLKPAGYDLTAVVSDRPAAGAAVFTRSRTCGPAVTIGRAHAADGVLQAVTVVAGNANVATGAQGLADMHEVVDAVATGFGIPAASVLPAATGVIGRYLPMPTIRPHLARLPEVAATGALHLAAYGIMTTDTVAKVRHATVGDAVLVGIAKGAGMMAPDMATLLAFFFTDAEVAPDRLDAALRVAMDRSFNRISIDSDTSTSDTAAVLANGVAGPVDEAAFEEALTDLATLLAQDVVREGEGVTKLLEVRVTGASTDAAARTVARSVVDSPLVKTAVFGADPNWGRVVMAIGKCTDVADVDLDRLRLAFGDLVVYDRTRIADDAVLRDLAEYLTRPTVVISIDLAAGQGSAVVWGCDLSYEYVRINGEYTS
jgi:glutamate N-acetyltransferase/amino-acid N-acetyltransferase